jgi:hypothetical protein
MNNERSSAWTELHQAAGINYTTRIQELIDGGADVNARDEYGNTPLHVAGLTVAGDAFRVLLEAGADPDAKNDIGNTPLDSFARACRAMAADRRQGRKMDNPPGPEDMGIPDIDGGQLAADAEAEKPRLQEEERQWQEQYNTPRVQETQETPETEQAETEELESQENLTTRLRPGL